MSQLPTREQILESLENKIKMQDEQIKYLRKKINELSEVGVEKLVSQKTADTLQQDIIDLLKRIQQIASDTIWMDELGSETVAERLITMYGELGGDENKIKFMYDSRFAG